MSKVDLYTGLKADLLTVQSLKTDGKTIMQFKIVELWRNLLQRESKEQPRLFPACFIEFMPSNYMELSSGLQSYDMNIRLHICFESYKDEDVDVLNLVDSTYRVVQGKQYSTYGVMKRRNEDESFDHDNVQDYMQDYWIGKAKDFAADSRPITPATITDVEVNPTITVIS